MTLAWALFILDWAARAVICGRVVMSRRPVPATLAWLFVLLLPVPYAGVIIYLVVGEVRLGTRRVERYHALTQDLASRATVFWRARSQEWDADTAPFKKVAHVATEVCDIPPLRGNHVAILGDCAHTIEAMVRDIDAARVRVHMVYYIWMASGAGEVVTRALERAAARGVACRVLVDAVGSKRFLRSELPGRLRRAGVKVAAALPVNPVRMLFSRIDLRNHRKIAVVDGWVAYAGSQNITDTSFGRDPRRNIGPWIDATARVEGPAAQALEVVFIRDWELETGERLSDHLEELLGEREIPAGGSSVHVVPSGPGDGLAAIKQAVLTAVFSARQELIITTPYFVPDEAMREALIAAAHAGIAVTVVVPARVDGRLIGAASRAHFMDLLEAGVRIMAYRNGLLHAKTVTVDANLAMIGSANVDMRSFMLNFEVTLFVYDSDDASLVRMLQMGYIQDSDEIFAEEWAGRPLWRRMVDNTARLFGPLL